MVELGRDALALDLLGPEEVVERSPALTGQAAHLCRHTGQEPTARGQRAAAEHRKQRERYRGGASVQHAGGADREDPRQQSDEDAEGVPRPTSDLLGLAQCPAHRGNRVRPSVRSPHTAKR